MKHDQQPLVTNTHIGDTNVTFVEYEMTFSRSDFPPFQPKIFLHVSSILTCFSHIFHFASQIQMFSNFRIFFTILDLNNIFKLNLWGNGTSNEQIGRLALISTNIYIQSKRSTMIFFFGT